jgi:hypothetical protein
VVVARLRVYGPVGIREQENASFDRASGRQVHVTIPTHPPFGRVTVSQLDMQCQLFPTATHNLFINNDLEQQTALAPRQVSASGRGK